MVANASHDGSKGFQPYPDSRLPAERDGPQIGYRLTSAGVKLGLRLHPDLRASASYQHTEGFVDFTLPTHAARAINERNEDIAWAKLDWTVSDKVQLFVKAYDHWWRSHYGEVDNAPGGGLDHVDDHEFWGFHDYGGERRGPKFVSSSPASRPIPATTCRATADAMT